MSTKKPVTNPGICSSVQHPHWTPPIPNPMVETGLMIANSLTDKKEKFYPLEGRTVKMYVCGPTVYDVSHVGHARTMLSFDILRRVLTDYFNYDVLYQVNITDIDDKIILKARKNELLRVYQEENAGNFKQVLSDVENLLEKRKEEILERIRDLSKETKFRDEREKTENETLLKQQDFHMETLEQVKLNVKSVTETSENSLATLIDYGRDYIGAWLDKEKGHILGGSDDAKRDIFEAHARKYENLFFHDCRALGIRDPDVTTRVTEFVPEIIEFIQRIVGNGFAYESNGSVYFDTNAFRNVHEYPKLVPSAGSGASQAEIVEGEGALFSNNSFADEKKHRNDFALWKLSKAGEPSWVSPWGMGRPGWHIECSVMASLVLGEKMDIHAGGVDLKFPHHDNEIAQTEAHFNSNQWVNYFLHAGHMHIKGLKMSKSLKNFISIKEALENYTARQIRIMFLLQQWDKPMNFSEQAINEARDKESRFISFFNRISHIVKERTESGERLKWTQLEFNLNFKVLECQQNVHAALCDNFSTPVAMTALDELVGSVNNYLIARQIDMPVAVQLLEKCARYVMRILSVFGVVGFGGSSSSHSSGNEQILLAKVIDSFCDTREKLRVLGSQTKLKELFQVSDEIRDIDFVNLGIRLEDDQSKSRWSFASPEELKREVEGKKTGKKKK